MSSDHPPQLPQRFRKLGLAQRRAALAAALGHALPDGLDSDAETIGIADLLVENAVGVFPVPLGIATSFRIDGREVFVPLATEEASVIAAASFAGRLLDTAPGIVTSADPPLATVQLFLEHASAGAAEQVRAAAADIGAAVDAAVPTLVARGGGYRGLRSASLPQSVLKVEVDLDVRDAMGANKVNTAGEAVAPVLERITGGSRLMVIVTNASQRSLVRAAGRVPVARLAVGDLPGDEVARRIVRAVQVATADLPRAVTHNKGVLNGVAALALATGNDTRAVEAAAHGWAAATGGYQPLTRFTVADGELRGDLEMPIPLASVGGSVDVHPVSRMALELLGNPDSRGLARIAAAVGLAQNLAALRALVSEGIQRGHMRHHAERIAFNAGARGDEVRQVARRLSAAGTLDLPTARGLLAGYRKQARAEDPAGQ